MAVDQYEVLTLNRGGHRRMTSGIVYMYVLLQKIK